MAKKRQRYNKAKPSTISNNGKKYNFKSRLELSVYKTLKKKFRNKKSIKLDYETDKLPYTLQKNYIPDFVITTGDGKTIYIEVKGYLRPSDRTKAIAVKQANPDADIRFVFSKDNRIHSKSKTTYSSWCKKNGFIYTVADNIPDEWFK